LLTDTLLCVFYSLIPDLCDSSEEDCSDPNREKSSSSSSSEISTESPGSSDSSHPEPAVVEDFVLLQEAAYRSFEEQHAAAVAAAAPAVLRDPNSPSLAETSLPYRKAKPLVQVEVTAIDPQDDNDDNADDPPIADISTVRPSRSPDRKRIASSGMQSPPKRHARYFPDGLPELTLPPPRGGSDGKGEGK
jgi:hypothetical protein